MNSTGEGSTAGSLTGFGFGPIQAGLFLLEAQRGGGIGSLTVAEVNRDRVDALRSAGGVFRVNVAGRDGVRVVEVGPVAILNPLEASDRDRLIEAVRVSEIVTTAVSSSAFYDRGGESSVAAVLARACLPGHTPVVYCAENHSRAASKLAAAVGSQMVAHGHPPLDYESAFSYAWQNRADGWLEAFAGQYYAFADTVIGKMSSVVSLKDHRASKLEAICAGSDEAFLVESFNDIRVSRSPPVGFPGFQCKDDLGPFRAAKLYGHNAVHAVAAYLAAELNLGTIAECRDYPGFMDFLRDVFIEEAGEALCRRYHSVDPLFTPNGFRAWVDDLLERMTNPFLSDPVERVARDPARKLGWNDRLVGALRLCIETDVPAPGIAFACAAAMSRLDEDERRVPEAPASNSSVGHGARPADTRPVDVRWDVHRKRLVQLWSSDPAFNVDRPEVATVLSRLEEGYREFERRRASQADGRPPLLYVDH